MLSTLKPVLICLIIILISACASNKTIRLFEKAPSDPNSIAILLIPIEIDLVYVDGSRENFLPAYQKYVSYELLPGKHVLGFRYQDMVLNEDGIQESVKSKTVIIRFVAKSGGRYIIDFTKPTTFAAALKLEKSFEITLSEQGTKASKGEPGSNKRIIARSFPAPESPVTSWFGVKPFSADEESLFNDEIRITSSQKPAEDAEVQAHLKYWWEQASPGERSAFKRWANWNQKAENSP